MAKTVHIGNKSLHVETSSILAGLGMEYSDAEDYLLEKIAGLIYECQVLSKPKAAYMLFRNVEVHILSGNLKISETQFDTGKIVASMLHNSEMAVVFASTIGSDVEQLSKNFMKSGEALEGYICDIIGSEMAEMLAESVQKKLEDGFAKKGLMVTNRFSPGYCNWPVDEQQKLFSLLGLNETGIVLTQSSLMLPEKSVSGLFGVGANVRKTGYKCNYCDDSKCNVRLKG